MTTPAPPARLLGRDLTLGVAGLVLILAASAALTYLNTRRLDADAAWVAHTNRVRASTADVLLSIVDAETGARGFVITGKEEFLRPHEAAALRYKERMAALKFETRDNDAQQARIRLLEERSAAILGRLERLVALRRASAEEAHAFVATGRGEAMMDALRGLVREMDDEEAALLTRRAARSARSYQVAVSTGLLTALLALALVGAFVALLRRNLRLRAATAAALRMERERLRVTLASIGDGVIATDPAGNVTFLNGVARALTGWADEALGRPLTEVFAIVNEATRGGVENPALRALAEGVVVGLANHTLLIARDGTERPIDDSAAPIRGLGGEVHGAVLVFRDITERKAADDALREAERRKSAVLRASLDAIVTIDGGGRVVAFNPAAEALFGYAEAEAVGADMGDLIVPESMRRGHREGMARYLATGEGPVLNRRLEMPARRKDGSAITVELVITQLDAGDRPLFTGFLRDITGRKRAEAELADRVRLLALGAAVGSALTRNESLPEVLQRCAEALVGHLDGAFARIWVLDPREGVLVLRASAGLYTHLDGPHGRVPVGQFKIGRIAQERAPHLTNAVLGDPRVPEQEWARREGMVAFAGYPLLLGDRLLGVMAMFARHPLAPHTLDAMAAVADEIALGIDRKHGEERLAQLLAAESERSRRLRQVAQASLTLNAADTPTSVLGVVRVEAQRIIGADRADVHTAADAPPPRGALSAPLVGRSGRPIGRIQLEGKASGEFTEDDEAILVQLAHMASVAVENARLYEELREGDRRKDEFLATLAHELRNPLAPIRNSLQVMRLAGADRPTVDDSRAMIERQVDQMVRLVDDLLDVSRISRGKMELRRGRVDLAAVIAGAVETSLPLIEGMGHTLTVALPPRPVHLDADPTRLAQVFLNLLNNAAKYSEPGGRISLTAGCEGGQVVVRVRDTGVGIPADMLSRVFELFAQVDRSLERSQGGLGIGLTLVKRLVEMHGGTVRASSDGPGAGSEFVVRLPALPESAAESGAAPAGEAAPARPGRRVLVVDDNRDSADSLTMLLEMLGNEVRTAYDGLDAVEAAAAFRPDLAFLDIGLPRLNGYDAARRIRQLPGVEKAVLVALTGWGQEEDRRRSREAGFDRHLVKPVDPEELERLLAGEGPV